MSQLGHNSSSLQITKTFKLTSIRGLNNLNSSLHNSRKDNLLNSLKGNSRDNLLNNLRDSLNNSLLSNPKDNNLSNSFLNSLNKVSTKV